MIQLMPCRNPCRFYIHLVFTYSIGPSSVVWSSELGPAPPFPPMRVLDVEWSRALSLVCEVAPSTPWNHKRVAQHNTRKMLCWHKLHKDQSTQVMGLVTRASLSLYIKYKQAILLCILPLFSAIVVRYKWAWLFYSQWGRTRYYSPLVQS